MGDKSDDKMSEKKSPGSGGAGLKKPVKRVAKKKSKTKTIVAVRGKDGKFVKEL